MKVKQKLDDLIPDLQALSRDIAQYRDLDDKIDKARAELSAIQEELKKAQADFRKESAQLAKAQVDAERQCKEVLTELEAKRSWFEAETAKAEQKLNETELKSVKAREQHDNLLASFANLRRRLEVA